MPKNFTLAFSQGRNCSPLITDLTRQRFAKLDAQHASTIGNPLDRADDVFGCRSFEQVPGRARRESPIDNPAVSRRGQREEPHHRLVADDTSAGAHHREMDLDNNNGGPPCAAQSTNWNDRVSSTWVD